MSYSIYSLCYTVLCACFVCKTRVFVSAGLTVEDLFDRFLGNEHEHFVYYHMKRISLTSFVHSLTLPGYFFGLWYFDDVQVLQLTNIWQTAVVIFSFTLPLVVVLHAYWSFSDLSNHTLVKTLRVFAAEGQSWEDVAAEINSEYRRVDKVCIHPNSLTTLVATPHWVIKLTPYTIDVVHQDHVEMTVIRADTYQRTAEGNVMVQYITVSVKCTVPGIHPFRFRMNSMDFDDLQNRLQSNIVIPDRIKFRKNFMEQFLEIFSETISENPPYELSQEAFNELDTCIGCFLQPASVKLVKNCSHSDRCMNCRCRPQWCLDCMGKWFASRQDQEAPETWLSSTCTCPICRSVFCILDVSCLKVHE